MALFVKVKDIEDPLQFHIQDTTASLRFCAGRYSRSDVEWVTADGHELQAIEQQLTNLRGHHNTGGEHPKGYSVKWRGEDAAFIVDNLHLQA